MQTDVKDTSAAFETESATLLAWCPLLAISDTITHASVLGTIVLLVLAVASVATPLLAKTLQPEMRFPAMALIVGSLVSSIALFMSAWLPELYHRVAAYLPFTAAAGFIVVAGPLTDAPSFKSVMMRTLAAGGITAVLMVIMGAVRELVAYGSAFRQFDSLVGAWAARLEFNAFRTDMGFLLAVLPPGAFIALGVVAALRNWWLQRRH